MRRNIKRSHAVNTLVIRPKSGKMGRMMTRKIFRVKRKICLTAKTACPSLRFHIGPSPSGKAPDFDSGIRWFDSNRPSHFNQRRNRRMNDAAAINTTEAKTFDYIEEANVTASNNFHGDLVPLYWFQGALFNAIKAIEQLDAIKKTLFYGRELTGLPEHHPVTTGCQHLPGMVDPEDLKRGELLLHSIVGTVTEAGEQLEMLSNVLFNGAKFDDVNFIEEVGDGFWYAAIGLKQVGATFGDVQHRNIAKLRHRFPQKFTEYDANNRDLFGERRILEMQSKPPAGYRRPLDDGEGHIIEVTDSNGYVKLAPGEKPECGIENWAQFGNVLIGDLRGHPVHGDTEGSRTSAIVKMDEANGICETKNTIYRLGRKA
ncbi:putative nucleotide pyrophosphohydrolase [Xanthomonas phage Langgrundblatt2]|uniref:Nucleotide pyrophosphohydrolase n=1 Tax=Xanthomonas phage Langgrundblatt2 TaxID=2939129 RepID=A0A9E7E1N4_9CAUD|nr:putative nucleotide pyrophosphohydrolase [Xanthomonas phage Langgrundblatt2]URA06894.1 putative nucleotide pyrophosphohydrolase [Xanthomonas phage Langgrundblatt2]